MFRFRSWFQYVLLGMSAQALVVANIAWVARLSPDQMALANFFSIGIFVIGIVAIDAVMRRQ